MQKSVTIKVIETPEAGAIQDYILLFQPSGTRVGVKRLSFIPLKVYLWIDLKNPSKSLFRRMKEELALLRNVNLVVNIEHNNSVTRRFAEWLGFVEIASTTQCLIMERKFD